MDDFQIYRFDPVDRVITEPLQVNQIHRIVEIQEYNDWCIRLNNSKSKVWFKSENNFVALFWDQKLEAFVIPNKTNFEGLSKRQLEKQLSFWSSYTNTVGLIPIYSGDDVNSLKRLSPSLVISSANLSERDYDIIIQRIGLLSLSQAGNYVLSAVGKLELNSDSGTRLESEGVKYALSLLNYYKTLHVAWKAIQKKPYLSHSLISDTVKSTSRHIQSKPSGIRKQMYMPTKKYHQANTVLQTLNNKENQFFIHALVLLRKHIQAAQDRIIRFSNRLYKEMPDYESEVLHFYDDFGQNRDHVLWDWYQRGVKEVEQTQKQLNNFLEELSEAYKWTTLVLKHPFLKNVSRDIKPSFTPSLALLRQDGYKQVYRDFYLTFGSQRQVLNQVSLERDLLIERKVKPSHALYEIWAFLEIYQTLIDYFGFQTVGETPYSTIKVSGENLTLAKNFPFKLSFTPINRKAPAIIITLTYEKQVLSKRLDGSMTVLTPDIVLEVIDGSEVKKFAIDAKYKKYSSIPYGKNGINAFANDMLEVAYEKYFKVAQHHASFLIHCDNNPEHTFWGEYFFSPKENINYTGIAHKWGSILATPIDYQNIIKLLKCLLMYHSNHHNFCWVCRREMEVSEIKERKTLKGYVVRYYKCNRGHNFWIKSHCSKSNGKHSLIKLGRSSFHRVYANNVWNCSCPECDDLLT